MKKNTYRDSGVDINAGYEAVRRIGKHVKKTFDENAISDLGGFAGMYSFPKGYDEPVLVSGTDGVGTKLIIAQLIDKHDTVGIDCVAMCVNDIICQGAKPLFFLDYIACGKNDPEKVEEIVKGVVEGCLQSKASLIGGETAEMPGMYKEDEYDIAGFAVGVVDRGQIINCSSIEEGDVVIGITSSGVHSNGFSLVRKVLLKDNARDLNQYIAELGSSLGEALLEPTKIYCRSVLAANEKSQIKGMSHITGGGFYENIPRVVPEGLMANIYKSRIPHQPIFPIIQEAGNIGDGDMYSTFNMGIGFVIVIAEEEADSVIRQIEDKNETPVVLGEIVKGGEGVKLWP